MTNSELSFSQLFEAQQLSLPKVGEIVTGTVVSINKDVVTIDAGLKSYLNIDREEFEGANKELEVQVGQEVEVVLERFEDGLGNSTASYRRAKITKSWQKLKAIHANKENVTGYVSGKVKGGFTVELEGLRAFLPGSLVDLRQTREATNLEGKTLDFKVIKLDKDGNNIVVSRRAVLEAEGNADREEYIKENLIEGKIVEGKIKNLTEYGAFVDLGCGIDGLLHITDMSWKRVKHPSEVVTVDQSVEVVVLKYEQERKRVSLGLKQLQQDPWIEVSEKYKVGDKLTGKVTNIADYGCFVEIVGGIEGLVHVTEMDWTNRNTHPSKAVAIGEEVDVQILEIDPIRRRISLGIKQCKENPWLKFAETYNRGDKVTGKIKSITEFGVFIGLEGGIDGLVHVSDLGLDPETDFMRKFRKGDDLTAVVLQIDAEKERISLGLKQLSDEEFSNFANTVALGSQVSATVVSKTDAKVKLSVEGKVDAVVDAGEVGDVSEGATLSLYVVDFDRKNSVVVLSVAPSLNASYGNEGSSQLSDALQAN